jgi:outer membrane protein
MKRIILALAACCITTSVSFAQDTTKIDLRKAIELALENNLNIKQAENLLERESSGVTTAWLALTPGVFSNVNANRSTGLQFNNLTGQLIESTVQTVSGSISGNWTLFSGLRNIYNLRSSQQSLRSQQEQVKRARELVIFNTAAAYLQILLDSKLLEIARNNLEAQQRQLDQIKAQVQVGARPQIDEYNQESIVASTELQLIQRENAINLDKIRLLRQLQIDPLKPYKFLVPEVADEKVLVKLPPALSELLERAYRNRTDLKSLEASISSQYYVMQSARGAYAPVLTLNASYGSNYNDQRFRVQRDANGNPIPDPNNPGRFLTEKISFRDQFFTENINKGVGLSFQMPIFQRWNRVNQVTQSRIAYKNTKLNYENQRLQVMQEVQQAYNDYVNFSKQVEATRKAYRAAQKALETEQERYKVGATTLIELTRANASYVEASANKANATYNYIFQEVLLDYFVGMITSDISFDKYEN